MSAWTARPAARRGRRGREHLARQRVRRDGPQRRADGSRTADPHLQGTFRGNPGAAHSSIVLTADTYTSVLPDVPYRAAEKVASLVLKAGCLIPGTGRRRRRQT